MNQDLKIGDRVQPSGIALVPPLAWEIVDFITVNGRKIKAIIEHPVSKDRMALEFVGDKVDYSEMEEKGKE